MTWLVATWLIVTPGTTGSWSGEFFLDSPMRLEKPLLLGREVKVELTWQQPDSATTWTLYENGEEVATFSGEPRIQLHHVAPGVHRYHVTARNQCGESLPSNEALVVVQ